MGKCLIVTGCSRAVAVRADIGRDNEIVPMFDAAFGPVAGLVDNAGITGGFARVEALTGGPSPHFT